jgi:plastocyanin
MNNKYIVVLIVAIIVVGGLYYFVNQNSNIVSNPTQNPVSDQTPASTTTKPMTNPAPVAPQVIHYISISGFAFVPSSITVRKGETIVWTNKDTAPHTVTGGDLQSSPLGQNQTYSFTYDKTGTFSYRCSIHPSMRGTITVTN